MKIKLFLTLLLASFIVGAVPPDVKDRAVSYDIPTTRTDGSVLDITEIDHYDIYCGVVSGMYDDIPLGTAASTVTSLTVSVPVEKTFCAMTTTDTDGLEGPYSGELKLKAQPGSPSNIRTITITIGVN